MAEERKSIREESSFYAITVAFPDVDPSFMAGFEAGMLWRELWSGKDRIEAEVYEESKEGMEKMAEHRGYECQFAPSEIEGKTTVTMKNIEHRDPSDVHEFWVEVTKL